MSSHTLNISGPSTAPLADLTMPQGLSSTTPVDGYVHSPTTRAAVLSHRSSMGTTGEEEMWALVAMQQHHCPISCSAVDNDDDFMRRLHEYEDQLLSHDEHDENLPPSAYDPDYAQYHAHHDITTYSKSVAYLLDTQATAATSSCLHPDLDAPSAFEKRYPFGEPSTSNSTPLGVIDLPLSQALEPSLSPTFFTVPARSLDNGHKRARDENENDIADDAPVYKRSRSSEDDIAELQIAAGESSAPGADVVVEALDDAEDEDAQAPLLDAPLLDAPLLDPPFPSAPQYSQRPRRTNDAIAPTLIPGIRSRTCGFPGCTTTLHPQSGENNRNHIKKKHYPVATLASNAQLACTWAGCGRSIRGKAMMAHIERDHIGYAYQCLVPGCRFAWKGSRAKDWTTHMNREHRGK